MAPPTQVPALNPAAKLLLMFLKATPFAGVAEELEKDLADGKIQLVELPGLVSAAATSADKVFPGVHNYIQLVHDVAVAINQFALAEGLDKIPTEVPVAAAVADSSSKAKK